MDEDNDPCLDCKDHTRCVDCDEFYSNYTPDGWNGGDQ